MRYPAFSIVVPTYRRRDVVSDAVRKIAAIEYPGEVELIVSIDGSDDGTREALAAIDVPFPSRILFHPNAGPAAARNRGAELATGEVLLFLDDDMMARPDILTAHALAYAKGADAVLGDIPLDQGSRPGFLSAGVGQWAVERKALLSADEPIPLEELISGHISVKREIFEALGGFDPRFTSNGAYGNEDIDFGIRLLAEHNVAFQPDAVAHHRFVNGPRKLTAQRFEVGQADVGFALKHPEMAATLFERRGISYRSTRWLLRPLARFPLLARPLVAIGAGIGEKFERVRGFPGRVVARVHDLATRLSYWLGVNAAGGIDDHGRLLVLCYHAVADLSDDAFLFEYGLPPERLADQFDALLRDGFVFITPDHARAFLENGAPIPRRAVLLTFDDCYAELTEVAAEILAPRGIRPIAFAVSGRTGQFNSWDEARGATRLPLLDAQGLRLLRQTGVEIGAHSRNHVRLTELDGETLDAETRLAADDIETMGVGRPNFYAYPYGCQDATSRAAVRSAGYVAGFSLRRAYARKKSDRFALPRVEIVRSDTSLRFFIKTRLPRLSAIFGAREKLRDGLNRAYYGTGRAVKRALGLRRRPT